MILEHELKLHDTSFDNPGLFSEFTYVKMKGPNKLLSNQSINAGSNGSMPSARSPDLTRG